MAREVEEQYVLRVKDPVLAEELRYGLPSSRTASPPARPPPRVVCPSARLAVPVHSWLLRDICDAGQRYGSRGRLTPSRSVRASSSPTATGMATLCGVTADFPSPCSTCPAWWRAIKLWMTSTW